MKTLAKLGVTGLVAGGLIFAVWDMTGAEGQNRRAKIAVPEFSELANAGKMAFEKTCAQCHGRNAVGTGKGPPLLHQVYNPGHHRDSAFYRAVRRGTQQHHWRFGNMPPQPQVTDNQIRSIIRYVRELQEANGTVYRRHRM